MKWLLLACPISLFAGWLAFPLVAQFYVGECTTRSLLIYDEPHKTVISDAIWDTLRGGKQHYYTSKLRLIPDNGPEENYYIERTLKTSVNYHMDSAEITSVAAFRIAGPDTSDPHVGRYIDPLSEQGFTARVYFFRVGERILSGFRDRPLVSCQKR
ncbi:hypothetical protein [Serratia odorifera]|uniref:Uncharacterized protein n=2 Tax=Serratia odorifera TaxID=618 RepID=D4E4E5_SEROD|nr:hypothetical protein [Serratia odorifera]EFE95354.1 hypothetical protein HMPREF0758_3045 [Serratia odorifera DSM 4582]MBJ2064639.1 hypothetical protein [Serratia odorifera]PNK90033.1 hypothetical protein CEQ31_010105 [Serratia odorifera]RII71092.1 hypothetical protein DX901_16215 [Serratia odorifera]VDZ61197.1 Uncharacterised protein [Serratia odorifera]